MNWEAFFVGVTFGGAAAAFMGTIWAIAVLCTAVERRFGRFAANVVMFAAPVLLVSTAAGLLL